MPRVSIHVRDETPDLSMQMSPVSLAALTGIAHLAAYQCPGLTREKPVASRCRKPRKFPLPKQRQNLVEPSKKDAMPAGRDLLLQVQGEVFWNWKNQAAKQGKAE